MLKPQIVEIDGTKFQFLPLDIRTATKLDKRLIALISPFAKADLTNMDKALAIVPELFDRLDDDTWAWLINTTMQNTTVFQDGFPPRNLSESGVMDATFQGRLLTLYRVLLETWRYNKLTVFQLAGTQGAELSAEGIGSSLGGTIG